MMPLCRASALSMRRPRQESLDDWANAIDQELKELSKFTDTALVVKMQ